MGQTARMRAPLGCVVFLLVLGFSSFAWPAPRAWLFDEEGRAAKLDLTRYQLLGVMDLPFVRVWVKEMAIDPYRGNLFVPTDRGPYRIEVLDVKTLQRKGRLDFTPSVAPTVESPVVRFVFPPTGNEIYVRWWNPAAAGGNGQFEVATIDARTFKTVARRTTTPPLEDRLLLDETGHQLYSITTWSRPARIDVFELSSLARTASINLESFLNPQAFGRGIDDFGHGMLLIDENEKAGRGQPNRYTLFVFDLKTRQPGPKMLTGLQGDGKLLPRTHRMLFDEVVPPKAPAPGQPLGPPITPGRVHAYDTTTGNRLATIQIPIQTMGWYLGVNPAEDTLYYLTDRKAGADSSQFILAIVSLQTFSIVKELAVPIGATRMFFFDE